MKKTWAQKLEDKKSLPKILKLEKGFPCYNALHSMGASEGDNIVLVNPGDVVAMMKRVPKGKLVTIREICLALARQHGVKGCCSLVGGIFVMTVANATEEAAAEGRKLPIPYWRTLKAEGFLNEKYPGGQDSHKKLLEEEGFKIIARGKKYQVAGWDQYLYKL